MGICYSSYINNNKGKGENNNNNFNGGDKSVDGKGKKSVSGEFSTFISKLSGGGAAAAAAAEQRALHQIPGRLFGNGTSLVSSLYTQQGKKGTNQDAMIVWENFCSRKDTIFCGVFDGHGPHGHMVARKVRDTLPLLLHTEWDATFSDDQDCPFENGDATGITHLDLDEFLDNDSGESVEAEDKEKFPEIHQPLKRSILKAFKLMDKELNMNPVIDCFCSGSTAVTMIRQGQDLIVGNIGDSRAVLATRDNDNSLMAVQLTVDLKPNLPREAARIQKCKGRVFALQDEPEVARVWLPHSDSPGLAMARAFGDFCLKDFGLISVPDVYYHHINERDEFVLLATDGVWDVLSNKEAVDIVAAAPSRATAARALVDCATRSWRLKYPTSKTDDCAVVCLYLDQESAEHNTTHNISAKTPAEEMKTSPIASSKTSDAENGLASHTSSPEHPSEIVPVIETADEIHPDKSLSQSKRSLAECLSTADDEEWSALEGISRVNSLLSIPRFLSINKRSASWRNWL